MGKIPLTESNTKATPSRQNSTKSPKRSASNKLQPTTTPSSARKVSIRKNSSANDRTNEMINIESKENTDLALEINITTGPNVQVN